MKKILITVLIGLVAFKSVKAQNDIEKFNPITTGVPFLLIAADPRAGALGDIGVVTSHDAFSQHWNPAQNVFALSKQGVGISYTPYLSKLVNDIFLADVTYYNRLSERSAVGASLRYFKLGDIEARQTLEQDPLILSPNEFTFDVSYALRLSERFSMAVSGRYLRSDLKLQTSDADASAASSFAVDVSGYYQSEEIPYSDFDGRWRMGFNISNIGPKIKYDNSDNSESNLPTNLALGGGFDFILDEYNKVGVSLEVNKLLVPTPQDPDLNGDGEVTSEEIAQNNRDYRNISFISGMFKSFGDAPGGMSEELKEFIWALGAEYWYQDVFAFRAGYFNESDMKGGRKFASVGAGFRYTAINIDISYLFGTGKVVTPLDGTLRFGLTFNFGDTYDEY
ncbi:type IX secretion system outer membrane channel protein PorV [Aequorivita sinensis]|uniref:type IX secretion system outer membrane channel protein PorV n=1 Tax=Aequorivita sinensis TaxID=1382458 RepID=UPI00230058C6|nr:type IX secretion system outer membrane channel protein PorV [Aequorivita sinensis]